MATEPVGCTLSAGAYAERLDLIRRVGADALLRVDRHADWVALRFRPGERIAGELREIRDAESRCCAFLRLELTAECDATVLSITSTTPDGAFMIAELANAFATNTNIGA